MKTPRTLCAATILAASALAAPAFAAMFESPLAQAQRQANARTWANAQNQLGQQIGSFNELIAAARAQFWATYPDKPGATEAARRFSDLLREKDIYFLTVVLSNGMADFGGVGAELDGQIRQSAGAEFEEWVNAVKKRTGGFGQSDVMRWWGATLNGPELAPAEYKRYCRERDWWEFDQVRRIPAPFDKPEKYGVYLYFRYKFTKLPKDDPRGQSPGENAEATYNKMVELFGKQVVHDAAKKVIDAPKTDNGRLEVTVKAPVKVGPSGVIEEQVPVLEQVFTRLTNPGAYTSHRRSAEIEDPTVPLPENVIGVFANPLTALELLVTKDDDRRFLLWHLSGRSLKYLGVPDGTTEWGVAEILYRRLVLAFGEKELLEVARVVRTATKRMTDLYVMDPEAIGARRGQPFSTFEDILARKNPRGYVRSALVSAERLDSPAAVDAAYKKLVTANSEEAVLEAARRRVAKPDMGRPNLVYAYELEQILEWVRNPPPPEAPKGPEGPLIDNAEYIAWKGFAPGAKVSYARRMWQLQRTRLGDDRLLPGPVDYNRAYQLQTIDNKQAKLWMAETNYSQYGQKRPPQDREETHPAKFTAPPTWVSDRADVSLAPHSNFAMGAEPDSTPVESGEEVIEIEGQRIATRWLSKSYHYNATWPTLKNWSLVVKVWTSDVVPTGLVRRTEDKRGPSDPLHPNGQRFIFETSLESLAGAKPLAAPNPSLPVTTAYLPPGVGPGGILLGSAPRPTSFSAPSPAAPPASVVPSPTSPSRSPTPAPPPTQPPQTAIPPGLPPAMVAQLELSQRLNNLITRVGRAKGELMRMEGALAGQGTKPPAEVYEARDRLDPLMKDAAFAAGTGSVEAGKRFQTLEDTVSIIEKYLKLK